MSKSLKQRAEHIQAAVDRRFEYQKFLGSADTEAMALDAIIRNIEIIGEAIRQLPDSFKHSHTEIHWHEAVGYAKLSCSSIFQCS